MKRLILTLLLIVGCTQVYAQAPVLWSMPYIQMEQPFGTQPAKWPWPSVTHVMLFGITPTASAPYYVANPSGFSNLQQIVNIAHFYNPPKKVIVSFDNSSNGGYPNISTAAANGTIRAGLVHSLAQWARSLGSGGRVGIDGFGFDFEGNAGGTQGNWDAVYQALRDTLNGSDFVCTDGGHGLMVVYSALQVQFPYNSPTTLACIDKFAVQGYDLNTSALSYPFVGMDPLEYGPQPVYGCANGVIGTNIIADQNDSSIIFKGYIAKGVPKSMILLGMNFYGRSYYTTVKTLNPDFCTPWSQERTHFLTYDQIVNSEMKVAGVVKKYNPITCVTILVSGDTSRGKRTYITEYSDPRAVQARAQAAIRWGLGGMFNYDLTWAHLNTVPAGYRADELQETMFQALNGNVVVQPPTLTVTIHPSVPSDTVGQTVVFTALPSMSIDSAQWTRGLTGGTLFPVVTTFPPSFTMQWPTKIAGNYTIGVKVFGGGQTATATLPFTVYDSIPHVTPPPLCDTLGAITRALAKVNKDSILQAGIAIGFARANQDSVYTQGWADALSHVPDSLTVPAQTITIPASKIKVPKP